jgi:hypothetical protein
MLVYKTLHGFIFLVSAIVGVITSRILDSLLKLSGKSIVHFTYGWLKWIRQNAAVPTGSGSTFCHPNPLLSRFLNSGFANSRKQVDVDWLKVTSHLIKSALKW